MPTKSSNHTTITWKHSDTSDTVSTLTLHLLLLMLSSAPIASRDYCNYVINGAPQYFTHKLQRVQNSLARFVLQSDSVSQVDDQETWNKFVIKQKINIQWELCISNIIWEFHWVPWNIFVFLGAPKDCFFCVFWWLLSKLWSTHRSSREKRFS